MRETIGVPDWETERLAGFTALTARRGQQSNLRSSLGILDSSGKKLCDAEFEKEGVKSSVVARGTLKVAGQIDITYDNEKRTLSSGGTVLCRRRIRVAKPWERSQSTWQVEPGELPALPRELTVINIGGTWLGAGRVLCFRGTHTGVGDGKEGPTPEALQKLMPELVASLAHKSEQIDTHKMHVDPQLLGALSETEACVLLAMAACPYWKHDLPIDAKMVSGGMGA